MEPVPPPPCIGGTVLTTGPPGMSLGMVFLISLSMSKWVITNLHPPSSQAVAINKGQRLEAVGPHTAGSLFWSCCCHWQRLWRWEQRGTVETKAKAAWVVPAGEAQRGRTRENKANRWMSIVACDHWKNTQRKFGNTGTLKYLHFVHLLTVLCEKPLASPQSPWDSFLHCSEEQSPFSAGKVFWQWYSDSEMLLAAALFSYVFLKSLFIVVKVT